MSRKKNNKYYQETKLVSNFLKNSRGMSKRKLREQQEESGRQPPPEETVEEQNEFKNAVDPLVQFDDILIKEDDVQWGGYLERFQLKFKMSAATQEGLYISANLAQLDEESLEVLGKLHEYYMGWQKKWAETLAA